MIMNKVLVIMAGISMAAFTSLVMADDQVQPDTQELYFTGSETAIGSDEKIIVSRELPLGLYITTGDLKSSCCSNTNKLIKAVFVARGFKLADDLPGSSMAIQFDFGGKINMDKVEKQASLLPELTTSSGAINPGVGFDPTSKTSVALTSAGFVIASQYNGNMAQRGVGAAGLISSLLPDSPHARDFAVKITASIWPKPELAKTLFGNEKVKDSPDSSINQTNVYYNSPKVGYLFIPPETMMKILVTSVNQWIDRYMVLDTNVASVGSSSGQTAPPAEVLKDCPDCPDMVVVPAGNFEMGSSEVENEKPVHEIKIAKPFAIGKYEVTQTQWKAVMGGNPSKFSKCGDYCPVENVSWDDAMEFVQKLNAKTGKQYRLPSEAEWEYACRAGGKQEYCGSDNVDSVSWYLGNNKIDHRKTHPVSTKQPNPWGVYDMSGNVAEWVEDSFHDNYSGAPTDGSAWSGDGTKHVYRGGGWNGPPPRVRAVYRNSETPNHRLNYIGFRLARMIQ